MKLGLSVNLAKFAYTDLIQGKPSSHLVVSRVGSGKHFFIKQMVLNWLTYENTEVIVIDVLGESYKGLLNLELGGLTVLQANAKGIRGLSHDLRRVYAEKVEQSKNILIVVDEYYYLSKEERFSEVLNEIFSGSRLNRTSVFLVVDSLLNLDTSFCANVSNLLVGTVSSDEKQELKNLFNIEQDIPINTYFRLKGLNTYEV